MNHVRKLSIKTTNPFSKIATLSKGTTPFLMFINFINFVTSSGSDASEHEDGHIAEETSEPENKTE